MNTKVLVLLVAACLSQEVFAVNDRVNKHACIEDADVNPALVEKAYNGVISDERELKCYFKCYYENAGYIDSNGEIQIDKLKEHIPAGTNKNMANKIIDVCKGKKGKDACETAYLTQKCFLDNNLKY